MGPPSNHVIHMETFYLDYDIVLFKIVLIWVFTPFQITGEAASIEYISKNHIIGWFGNILFDRGTLNHRITLFSFLSCFLDKFSFQNPVFKLSSEINSGILLAITGSLVSITSCSKHCGSVAAPVGVSFGSPQCKCDDDWDGLLTLQPAIHVLTVGSVFSETNSIVRAYGKVILAFKMLVYDVLLMKMPLCYLK